MKIVMLTSDMKLPDLQPGDTLHISLMQGEKETTHSATKEPFHIWVCPVEGGYLMRNTHRNATPGPMFFVDNSNPMEYFAALTAMLADDRL